MLHLRAFSWVRQNKGTIHGKPYIENGRDRCLIECQFGHHWTPSLGQLAYKQSWCSECRGNKKHTLQECHITALSRGGKCLSKEYKNNKEKLNWECAFGHKWPARYFNILVLGQWCPHCHVNLGEELSRAAFKEALGKSFPRTRSIEWLEGLELDGQNGELAFEVQGSQHSTQHKFFHRSPDDLASQIERDIRKADLCQQHWTTIIEIPHTVPYKDIRRFARNEIDILGYSMFPMVMTDAQFFDSVRARGKDMTVEFDRLRKMVAEKGGEVLAQRYLGYDIPVGLRCKNNHEFEATARAILQPKERGPRFCKECAGHTRSDQMLMDKLAEFGYELLKVFSKVGGGRSYRYIEAQCPNKDHPSFEKLLNNLKLPTRGCPKCGYARCGKNAEIQIGEWCRMSKITQLTETKNVTEKSEWKCTKGHHFEEQFSVLCKKKKPCNACFIDELRVTGGITLSKPWDKQMPPSLSVGWTCIENGHSFRSTLSTLARYDDRADKRACGTCRKT